ncbi:MAG: hypothetical protein R2749_31575 [Acidimicrobiales bacterium]
MSDPSGPCQADSSAMPTPAASIASIVCSTLVGCREPDRPVQRSNGANHGRRSIRRVGSWAHASIAPGTEASLVKYMPRK